MQTSHDRLLRRTVNFQHVLLPFPVPFGIMWCVALDFRPHTHLVSPHTRNSASPSNQEWNIALQEETLRHIS